MKGNRRTDTKPERVVRSELHRRGRRFRKDHGIRLSTGRLVKPDIVFTRQRLAVFIDGCFWHCCPDHGHAPTRNTGYWGPKLQRNVDRDRRNDGDLATDGWVVVRIWEHEPPGVAADRVEQALEASGQPPGHRLPSDE